MSTIPHQGTTLLGSLVHRRQFFGTSLSLGSLLIAAFDIGFSSMTTALGEYLLGLIATGLLLEAVGLLAHGRTLKQHHSEGAASYYLQTTRFGYAYWLRNGLLTLAMLLSAWMLFSGELSPSIFALLGALVLSVQVISRALFYVVVIPTTMPGAFFWKNQGFVEHARETGLADMPQMGVAYEKHHAFNISDLIDTIKSTTLQQNFSQLRRILTG